MKNNLLEKVKEIVVKQNSSPNHLSEERIAHQLGVSRTPIREVLSHLQEEGLLERKHKKGITLKEPSLRELIEIYDLLAVLEGLAAKLLATEIDERTLDELNSLAQNFNKVQKSENTNYFDREKADIAFHRKIIENCGNKWLKKIIDNFHLITLSFQLPHQKEFKPRKLRYPHEDIIKTLKNKDPEKAELTTRLHIQERKENLIREILGLTSLSSVIASPVRDKSLIGARSDSDMAISEVVH